MRKENKTTKKQKEKKQIYLKKPLDNDDKYCIIKTQQQHLGKTMSELLKKLMRENAAKEAAAKALQKKIILDNLKKNQETS